LENAEDQDDENAEDQSEDENVEDQDENDDNSADEQLSGIVEFVTKERDASELTELDSSDEEYYAHTEEGTSQA
jgi:hypothetical protein